MSYTKGPWGTGDSYKDHPGLELGVYCDDSLGSMIADCRVDMAIAITYEEKKANARLISCAPELLEALKEARDYLCSHPEWQDPALFVEIDALIAKATGGTE